MKHHVDLHEILGLAALEERAWQPRLDALRASGVPLMEAGGAAATATATDAGDAGAAAAGTETAPAAGLPPEVATRFDTMERSMGDLVSRFETVFAGEGGEGEQIDPNDPIAAFLAEQAGQQQVDPLAALLGEPQAPQANDQLSGVLRAMAERDQTREQQFNDLAGRVQFMQLAQDAQDLETRYPELADRRAADAAIEAATEWARSLGMEQLGHHPQVVELVYRASKADAAASGEVPAGADGHVSLESGSGAAQLQSPQERAQGIVNAGGGHSFWTG